MMKSLVHEYPGFLLGLLLLAGSLPACPDSGRSPDPDGPDCANGQLDPDEADVDCGGQCENACRLGRACARNDDCASGLCDGVRCADPCLDGVRSADETDVDCGGSCSASCGVGQNCSTNSDCMSDDCSSGTCQSACGNGRRDALEVCDGDVLGGATCVNLGFADGTLSCDSQCNHDTSRCGSCPAHTATSRGTLGNTWTRAGPPGGHVTALLALGNDVVLAGTGYSRGRAGARPLGYGSAIYRSADGGVTFSLQQRFVDDYGNTVRRFARVGTTDRIYAAVGASSAAANNGIWVSGDAGLTWTDVSTGLHGGARPRWVVVAPGTPERVYAMIEGSPASPNNAIHSLYRRDAGADWTRMATTGVDQITGGPALALAVHLTNRDTVFLANSDRFFTSVNGGADFTALTLDTSLFAGASNTKSLFVDPNNGDHIVLTTRFEEMIESTDGGLTWTTTNIARRGQRAVVFSSSGVSTQTFVATPGDGLQVSSDGTDFSRRGICMGELGPTAVSVAPDDPDQIFVGFDGQGVLHSEDGGQTFTPQTSGIDDLLAKVVVTGPAGAPVAWIVSPAGLFRSSDGGTRWTRIAAHYGTLAFTSVTQDPDDDTRVLAGTNGGWYGGGGYSQGVFDIDLGAGTVTRATGFFGDSPEINAIAFDPTDASIVLAYQDTGSDGDPTLVPTGVLRSTDGGRSFSPTGLVGDTFLGYTACSGSQMFMTGSGIPYFCIRPLGGVSRLMEIHTSSDQGATFDLIWAGESTSVGNLERYYPYSGIYVDGSDNIYFTAAGTEGLAWSTDGGQSFGDFGTGLSSFAQLSYHLVFTPGGGILLGTEDAAYYAVNGVDFVELNEGFESFSRGPRAHSVAVLPGTPQIALIATVQGVYRRTLP